MKNKIGLILCCIFLLVIAALIIISLIFSSITVFDFFKNVALNLGNGNIFAGIPLTILALFGLSNSVIGLFNPPQWLNDLLENAPKWIGYTYVILSLFGTIALFLLFITAAK